jgi:inosine-uridine nucleoside N-ribohydrolase
LVISLVVIALPSLAAEKIRVILDTDANNELDDQHAIAYLLFNGHVFNVEGITVNRTRAGGDIHQHYAEAVRVVELCGLKDRIKVYRGADGPFTDIKSQLARTDFDGAEAVNFIIQRAKAADSRRLVLLPVGKLTNIALALAKDPSIASKVRIVWLGSNYPEPGEYNQVNDEPSLNYILDTGVDFEIALVRYGKPSGTDAVRATLEEIRRIMPGKGPRLTPAVKGRHGGDFHHFGNYALSLFENIQLHGNPPSRALFDMAAVAIVKNPGWATAVKLPAPILKDAKWVARPDNPRRIILWENFDRPAIMKDFYDSMTNYRLAGSSQWPGASAEVSLAVGARHPNAAPLSPPGGALTGERFRVIVSTDIGGSDPDDVQSMVHYLVYADVFDTEGLISSPPHAGRKQHILEALEAYAADYSRLRAQSARFPSPDALRAITKQGAVDPSPEAGYSTPTEGSRWIIERARADDPRPLWILVWGSITDLAQALHDDPGIKPKLRVYFISSWNRRMDPAARDYVVQQHPDLWHIEADTTFRGMYVGGTQDGDLGNREFIARHVNGHGALGDLLASKKADIKMGDTPSVLYLMRGAAENPAGESWGGAFVRPRAEFPYWTDNPAPALREGNYPGAKTVNQWREAYLRDWQQRMAWLKSQT